MELIHVGRSLSLDRVAVMGVLNVTPDSFSDGGLWLEPEAAVAHGMEMAAAGAQIVDVGGESTRPGATPVSEDEELRRVVPVVEALAARLQAPISIDTRKARVAREAVAAGATIINDTCGEAGSEELLRVAVESGAAVVIMHSRGTPATMKGLTEYDDVVDDVARFLRERAKSLIDSGVDERSIALDPGIGFAKNPAQNLEILRRLDELCELGFPVLVGTSRKSFIGAVLDLPEHERLEATCATVVWSVAKGVRMVRVHDVAAVTRAVRMTEAIVAVGE